MAYKIARISPSALAATEYCPRFRPDGEDSQAGIDGTMFHEAMEKMITEAPRSQWSNWVALHPELGPQILGLVEQATETLLTIVIEDLQVYPNFRLRMRSGKPRKSPLKPGLYPELELERGQGRHGYIDLMVVTPEGLVYIIDWKSNRVGKDFSWQLGAYAVDVNNLCTAHDSFVCMIVAPRLDEDEQLRMEISSNELTMLRERIARIEKRADDSANDDSIPGCPGDQCEHCHWKGRCKYQAASALAISEAVPTDFKTITEKTRKVSIVPSLASLVGPGGLYEGEVVDSTTFSNPSTPKQRGLRRACLKFLEVLVNAAKEDDKKWAKQYTNEQLATIIPGFSVSRRNGRGSFDSSKVAEVREKVMSEFGLSIEDVFEVSAVDKELLKSSLVIAHGFTKKHADEEVKKIFEPFTTPGAPTLFWTMKSMPKQTAIDADFVDVK